MHNLIRSQRALREAVEAIPAPRRRRPTNQVQHARRQADKRRTLTLAIARAERGAR